MKVVVDVEFKSHGVWGKPGEVREFDTGLGTVFVSNGWCHEASDPAPSVPVLPPSAEVVLEVQDVTVKSGVVTHE